MPVLLTFGSLVAWIIYFGLRSIQTRLAVDFFTICGQINVQKLIVYGLDVEKLIAILIIKKTGKL